MFNELNDNITIPTTRLKYIKTDSSVGTPTAHFKYKMNSDKWRDFDTWTGSTIFDKRDLLGNFRFPNKDAKYYYPFSVEKIERGNVLIRTFSYGSSETHLTRLYSGDEVEIKVHRNDCIED